MAELRVSIKDLPEVQKALQEAHDDIERLEQENRDLRATGWLPSSSTATEMYADKENAMLRAQIKELENCLSRYVVDLRTIANVLCVGGDKPLTVVSTHLCGLIMEKIAELKERNENQADSFWKIAAKLGFDVGKKDIFSLGRITEKIDEMKEHIAALASARDTELHWEEQVAHELGLPDNNRLILGAVRDLKAKYAAMTSSTIEVVSWDGGSTVTLACSDAVCKAWVCVQSSKARLHTILGGLTGEFSTKVSSEVLWNDVIAKVVEKVKMANVASMADAKVGDLARQLREVRSVVGASPFDSLPEFIMRKFEVLTIHDETEEDLQKRLRCTTQDLNATRAKVEKLERQIEKFKKEQARGEKWENSLRAVLGIAPAHTPGASIHDAVIAIYAERDKYRNEAAKWEAQARVAKKQERDRADEIF